MRSLVALAGIALASPFAVGAAAWLPLSSEAWFVGSGIVAAAATLAASRALRSALWPLLAGSAQLLWIALPVFRDPTAAPWIHAFGMPSAVGLASAGLLTAPRGRGRWLRWVAPLLPLVALFGPLVASAWLNGEGR